ncbi:MAG: siroheme synthase CysG [Pseudomonadales bacterium]|jgi:uroporphyrin-III C-methyltransferase/precorrin-2 dehydrogenase/sirohydrochlorin ferrochelatase
MQYLPISYNIKNKTVLVIGGGAVAARKAQYLIRAGGVVTVVSPKPGKLVSKLADSGQLQLIEECFKPEQVAGKTLIVAATNHALVNRSVFEIATSRHIPVNVVDQPELCSFVFPAVVDRSPVTIAISTSGSSPVLARLLKAKIEAAVPSAYGRLASLLGSFRNAVKLRFQTSDERRRFWEETLESPVFELALAGNLRGAKTLLEQRIAGATSVVESGEVYLLGAGPGDPDLLTLRAARLLHKADIVFYDGLVGQPILDLCRREAEMVYVGKSASHHSVPQAQLTQALIDAALSGKKVVRLKGGDPFVFGRGGEEVQELAARQIPFQIIPGITAATGCGAYAGIPLTHRDYAQSVTFVTGHTKNGKLDINWSRFAGSNQTLVFYMGLANAGEICRQLKLHGAKDTTPAALVVQGTTPNQQVIVGDLNTLPALIAKSQPPSPALIIVGEVVKLHSSLQWFESEQSQTASFTRPSKCALGSLDSVAEVDAAY